MIYNIEFWVNVKRRWGAKRILSFLFHFRLCFEKSYRAWYDDDADGIFLKKKLKNCYHAQNKIIISERSGSTVIVVMSVVLCLMAQVVHHVNFTVTEQNPWPFLKGSNQGPISVQSCWNKNNKIKQHE